MARDDPQGMTKPVVEGLERLASRLALLTSDDGEAENAGRAAGQLARRLGLSGGQIKAIFLAGVRAAGVPMPLTEAEAADVEQARQAQSETQELRRLLDASDYELLLARRQHDAALDENEQLREALDRARVGARVLRVALVVLLAAALAAGGFAWFGPRLPTLQAGVPPTGSPFQRMGVAAAGGANLYDRPEAGATRLGGLPAGARLPVRQLLWRGFTQWVETEAGGQIAYAPATEVDLR